MTVAARYMITDAETDTLVAFMTYHRDSSHSHPPHKVSHARAAILQYKAFSNLMNLSPCESEVPKKGITESALSNPQKSDNCWEFNGT
ncbi:hypothetical protein Pelo_18148 [Pelomyxa schiedti]|nr:hypothetical protein Pelo_18148 [Pelomyxa schiedti]